MAHANVFNLPRHIYEKFEPEPMSGCWLWLGAQIAGYGSVWFGDGAERRSRRAHRVVYELLKAPIPEGLVMDHKCRTPSRINPDHLEPVTVAVSIQRGIRATKFHCAQGHALSGDNLFFAIGPEGCQQRKCRQCSRNSAKRQNAKPENRAKVNTRKREQRRRFRALNPIEKKPLATHCVRGHPLSGDNLYIGTHRSGRKAGKTMRICKACHRLTGSERARRYNARKRAFLAFMPDI